MPRRALKKPVDASPRGETVGARIARLRKERGLTQVELATTVDSIQVVISDYERGKLRPNPEMIVAIAGALGVTTDELLGAKPSKAKDEALGNRRLLRRLRQIDRLPRRDQDALLRTIDAFLDRARTG
jgi:transcriptional regulator with XRE-family HTH domain